MEICTNELCIYVYVYFTGEGDTTPTIVNLDRK